MWYPKYIKDRAKQLADKGYKSETIVDKLSKEFPEDCYSLTGRTVRNWLKIIVTTEQTKLFITKAQEEHLDEIHTLIKEWRNSARTPSIKELTLETKHPTNIIEDSPLFVSLKEHLSFSDLWKNYVQWTNKTPQYLTLGRSLIEDILQDVRVIKGMGKCPALKDDSFYRPVLQSISEVEEGKTPSYFEVEPPEPISAEEQQEVITRTETITITQVDLVIPDVCYDFINSEKASELIEIFRELKKYEDKIQRYLQEITLRRDYITRTCNLCPGRL